MMFRAPAPALAFALRAVGHDALAREAFPDLDAETVEAVLAAAADLANDVFAPLNAVGDREGARLENGRVRAAPGFAEAYRAFSEGGWNGLSADPAVGGQGLTRALELAVFEMAQGANLALALCPMLNQAAVEALWRHGSDRQKAVYLPRLVSGEWTGAMALTEPQAGSDLAALTTRAEPDGAGGYRLTGQKIFITWGDHDMADNIVHLVLARLPDAPAGVRGISLFLASKRLVDDDGRLGVANAFHAAGLEHKLGIHASPTCVMAYEGAQAELVGEANAGLAHMFVMMNAARLQVGVQGVGIAERAYQQAAAFAHERRQGRSAWGGAWPAPIHDHPDVRRMLMLAKAKTEAARGLCLLTGVLADRARVAPDEVDRADALARQEFLTPVAKAWSTDIGVEVASLGVQVHGGMGYVEETGAAQHLRDARIAPIYEGANGVQAIDLVGRKLAGDDGRTARALAADVRAAAGALAARPALASAAAPLAAAAQAFDDASAWLLAHEGPDRLAGASTYLSLVGDAMGGWVLAREAMLAEDEAHAEADDRARLLAFYASQVLSLAPGKAQAAVAGAEALAAWSA